MVRPPHIRLSGDPEQWFAQRQLRGFLGIIDGELRRSSFPEALRPGDRLSAFEPRPMKMGRPPRSQKGNRCEWMS